MTVWYSLCLDTKSAIAKHKQEFAKGGEWEPCFGWYYSFYKKEYSLYYMFKPKDSLESFVADFNSKFNNIKLSIIKEFILKHSNRGWETNYTEDPSGDRFVFCKVDILGAYNNLSQYVLPLVCATLLRYNDEQYFKDDNFSAVKSVITYNNQGNHSQKEPAISYYPFDYDTLMVLDDVERMNKIFDGSIDMYYGYGEESITLECGSILYVGAIFKAILIDLGKDPNDGEYDPDSNDDCDYDY